MDEVWRQAPVHTIHTQQTQSQMGACTSPHTTHSHGWEQAPVHITDSHGWMMSGGGHLFAHNRQSQGKALVHTQQTQSWMDGRRQAPVHMQQTVMDGWSEAGTCSHATVMDGWSRGQAPVHMQQTQSDLQQIIHRPHHHYHTKGGDVAHLVDPWVQHAADAGSTACLWQGFSPSQPSVQTLLRFT